MSTRAKPARVGELRPSALVHTFGVGAVVDLPQISVMVMGLDEWQPQHAEPVEEPRLVRSLQQEPGLGGLERLLRPPIPADAGSGSGAALDATRLVGVPVAVFPQWLFCPVCRRLAPIASDLFELRTNPFRMDRTKFVHKNCSRARVGQPNALPARFVVACPDGHMDDFPWVAFVHRETDAADVRCHSILRLDERGVSAEIADVWVHCETCDTSRPMTEAFGEEGTKNLPDCTGGHPHLRERDTCANPSRAMLLGASNAWFAVARSALSLPDGADPIAQLVAGRWSDLQHVTGADMVPLMRAIGKLTEFDAVPDAAIWAAIDAKRSGGGPVEPTDLRVREWQILTAQSRPSGPDFSARDEPVPERYTSLIERVVLVDRLREVQALMGFTRVEGPGEDVNERDWARLGRGAATWLPAAEVHGEGIFLQLREDALADWVDRAAEREQVILQAHLAWCARRGMENAMERFPGIRTVLVHSLSHALMRQLALESGYSQAAIRERIYGRATGSEHGPMAGLLLYTAAPGSEGTLGGLVALGANERFGRILDGALRDAMLCNSDPLCAEAIHHDEGLTANGAACFACLFAPETSCERANRSLDRGCLTALITGTDAGYFTAPAR